MLTARLNPSDDLQLDKQRAIGLRVLRSQCPTKFGPNLKFLDWACKAESASADGGKLECLAFVMSIDVRHSTRVLEEVRGRQFSEFMDKLCNRLCETVNRNYGICYQYTGDGILSVFPRCFTGEKAAYWVAKAATESHQAFRGVFDEIRDLIEFVPWGMGLGIGIDWGRVWVVQIVNEYVCVGGPVVSACRMGGGSAHSSLINQQGYNEFRRQQTDIGEFCKLEKQSVFVKHKGEVEVFHIAKLNEEWMKREPELLPEWARET